MELLFVFDGERRGLSGRRATPPNKNGRPKATVVQHVKCVGAARLHHDAPEEQQPAQERERREGDRERNEKPLAEPAL